MRLFKGKKNSLGHSRETVPEMGSGNRRGKRPKSVSKRAVLVKMKKKKMYVLLNAVEVLSPCWEEF